MKKLLLLLLASLLMNSSFAQIKNYNYNSKVKILTENTTLKITGIETRLNTDRQSSIPLLAAGTILPPAIDYFVASLKEKTAKDALSYKGIYKCFASGDTFYLNNDFALLPKLTITRKIRTKGGEDLIAAEIELLPELSADKTAFRYLVKDKCLYKYSIAKTKGRYDYIDLNLDLTFRSIFINKENYKIEDLRKTSIIIPMILVGNTEKLDDCFYSGWIPLPTRSTYKQKDIYERIPASTGQYEIEIIATETNPYKIKAENKKDFYEATGKQTSELLKSLIKIVSE
jgi:hypothetical protein